MRIDKLELTNFKNFRKLSAAFLPGVNLFVGSNGSGKTSVLEAINVAVGGFFGSQGSKAARQIQMDEISLVGRLRQPSATVFAQSSIVPGSGWSRTLKANTKSNDLKGVALIQAYGTLFFNKYFPDPEDRHVAPLIAYYSTQRLFKDSNNSEKQKYDASSGRLNGYLLCLKETAIKGILDEWLRNAVIRRASKHANGIFEPDLILQNVEMAVKRTLVFALEVENEMDLAIYPDPDFDNEIFVRYDYDHDLPLGYYSDGFRNLVYLIIDMVWRASQLNPWLDLDGLAAQVTGVVTIDEIDLHLHPKWQMKAVQIIQELFPNVQFFITTHSPTIVSNMQKGTLYIIRNNEITQHADDFFGKQVDNIMRTVIGAPDRNIGIQDKLNLLFRLIDQNNVPEYTRILNELTELLSNDDPDIQKALSLIAMQDFQNEN